MDRPTHAYFSPNSRQVLEEVRLAEFLARSSPNLETDLENWRLLMMKFGMSLSEFRPARRATWNLAHPEWDAFF